MHAHAAPCLRDSRAFGELTAELSAVLGAAYESFLKARLERRDGRRGKVDARAVVTAIDMVAEMIAEAAHGQDAEALWLTAVAELAHGRGETEAGVLAHQGFVVVEHEWAAFLEWSSDRAKGRW